MMSNDERLSELDKKVSRYINEADLSDDDIVNYRPPTPPPPPLAPQITGYMRTGCLPIIILFTILVTCLTSLL